MDGDGGDGGNIFESRNNLQVNSLMRELGIRNLVLVRLSVKCLKYIKGDMST